jgi:WD40 repeat protein
VTAFEPERRQFVAIATAEYTSSFEGLPGVRNEVDKIRHWLTGGEVRDRGFEHVHDELAKNPSLDAIETAFKRPHTRVDWCEKDAAVVYITGHGMTQADPPDDKGNRYPRHILVLKDTEKTELDTDGLETASLLRWLSKLTIEHLLVIIDACFAGEVTRQIEGLASTKKHWLVLPSATSEQKAQQSALTNAIGKFIADGRKYDVMDPYYHIGTFVGGLNEILAPDQRVEKIYKGGEHEEHVCLPNPFFQPGKRVETVAARRALALEKDAFELHNRVDGHPVVAGDPPGWLFAGREELMRDLIRAAGTPGVTVITGSAGCGKSTALSRLVTLSDPAFRGQYASELLNIPEHMWPQEGAVRLAVSARKKSNEQLLGQMCFLLDIQVEVGRSDNKVGVYRDALSEYVANDPEPLVTIVIDALDEANEKSSLVRSVLDPLRRQHPKKLCLLIGVRSLGGDGVVDDVTVDGEPLTDLVRAVLDAKPIPVDRAPRWNPADIDVFVRNILTNTPNSPYRNEAGTVAEVSTAISEVAGTSYLMARVAAESLADRPDIIAPDDQAWLSTLNDRLPGVLRDDLTVSIPTARDRRKGVALLRAVAFARGNGLPWSDVWARVATAVDAGDSASRSYGDDAVDWLLESRLNAYLVTDRQDGLTVYRLLHDQLQKILQHQWRELLKDPAEQASGDNDMPPAADDEMEGVEERIFSELNVLVPRRPSVAVNQQLPVYVRRYLAEHALAGGVLGQLPVPFLPYLDLAGLRAAIGVSAARRDLEESVPWLPLMRQVTHLWDWNQPARNAAAIEMWAALTRTSLPVRVGGPWQVRWAAGPPDNGILLGRHDHEVSSTATADLSGTPIAVTGGMSGVLRIWDLSKGTDYREPIDTGGEAVRCVATARLADNLLAITGCADGTIRIWELPSGRAVEVPVRHGSHAVVALTVAPLPDGRAVVAAADESGTIRTWDLETRDPVGAELKTGLGLALGLATARVGKQVLGLATGSDGGLEIWNLATGARWADRLTAPEVAKPSTTTGTAPGGPAIRDAKRSTTRTAPGGPAIAVAARDNREIAITGYGNGLQLWDLRDRKPTDWFDGNQGRVRSLAVIQREDRIVAVTGGNKAVRAWDLTAGEPSGELLTGHDESVNAVAVIESADGTLAVSASRDRTVRVWEMAGDRLSGAQPSTEQLKTVNAVATAMLRGNPVAITCTHDVVQVRDLEQGTLVVPPLTGHASTVVSAAAAALPDGGVLVVAGGWDGSIRAWSAADSQPVGQPTRLHRGGIASLATAELADGRVVAVSGGWDHMVRVWDPYTSAEACEPLPDHADVVLAVTTVKATHRSLVISGSREGHVRIHDLDAHASSDLDALWPPVDIDTGQRVASLAVAQFPNGRLSVVVGGEDGVVQVVELQDGAVVSERSWPASLGAVAAVAVGHLDDGHVVFTGSTESLVQAWDLETGRALSAALPTPGPVLGMTYHTEPPRLLIGGAGAAVVHPLHSTR